MTGWQGSAHYRSHLHSCSNTSTDCSRSSQPSTNTSQRFRFILLRRVMSPLQTGFQSPQNPGNCRACAATPQRLAALEQAIIDRCVLFVPARTCSAWIGTHTCFSLSNIPKISTAIPLLPGNRAAGRCIATSQKFAHTATDSRAS